jgi:hypothetical protein|tara:strand:- start:185 stop:406 length:222 start_codon:yes stop_codon:yes gene_type:complete
MTEKEEDKFYDMLKSFHKAAMNLGHEARADDSHGGGIQTKAERDDFIQHFEKLLNKTNSHFQNVKTALNNVVD